MTSWKTTVAGLVSAVCISLYPLIKDGNFTVETLLVAAGVAIVGFFAKDSTAYTKEADKKPEDRSVSQNLQEVK